MPPIVQFFTSYWWTLLVFAIFTLVFHLLFLWLIPLSSIGWKKVDYWWLAMALLGIVGSVTGNRMTMASLFLPQEMTYFNATFNTVRSAADLGVAPAICLPFVVSEFSPPPEEFAKIQKERVDQCRWFREVEAVLAKFDVSALEPLRLEELASPRPSGGNAWAYQFLDESIAQYNEELKNVLNFRNQTRRGDLELMLQILSPSLLAVALALRMTKVSGEIRLSKSS